MLCYGFFAGINEPELDAFVLGMDLYYLTSREAIYRNWFFENEQHISETMGGVKGILGVQTYLSLFAEDLAFVHNFKDFYEGK
jgi:hypothetical protein